MDEQLIQAVTELNEKRVIQLVKEELKIGRDPDDHGS